MKDKKHIDRLFEEGFKNFEASPSPKVWDNIQARLNEQKKERNVIPIWWKLAGVAALIALLFLAGTVFFKSQTNSISPVVNNEVNETTPTRTAPLQSSSEDDDAHIVSSEESSSKDKVGREISTSEETEDVNDLNNASKKDKYSDNGTFTNRKSV